MSNAPIFQQFIASLAPVIAELRITIKVNKGGWDTLVLPNGHCLHYQKTSHQLPKFHSTLPLPADDERVVELVTGCGRVENSIIPSPQAVVSVLRQMSQDRGIRAKKSGRAGAPCPSLADLLK